MDHEDLVAQTIFWEKIVLYARISVGVTLGLWYLTQHPLANIALIASWCVSGYGSFRLGRALKKLGKDATWAYAYVAVSIALAIMNALWWR